MSLDVYLHATRDKHESSGIECCTTHSGGPCQRCVYCEEWVRAYEMDLPCPKVITVYSANITHNLGQMAEAADIYQAMWRPEEIGVTKAIQLIPILEVGLAFLKSHPERYKKFNAPNGWGKYEHFVPFVENYLAACKEYPEATVEVSR